jgi:chemotaxis protein MotB
MAHGEEPEGGNSERWLVSYADFITLLMVLFVVLYSMGKMDVEKYKRLADSMRSVFTLGGPVQVVDAQISQSGGSIENGNSKPIVVPGIPEGPPQSVEVAGQLTKMLSDQNLGSEVSVQTNIEGVLISLSEKLVFAPGLAQLPPEVLPVLDAIVELVKPISNPIRLVGHTDNTPPTGRYTSNWELSFARAMAVADYMIKAGIDPSRIMVAGRGENDAIFPNDTAEHRSMNGRVDIIVIYQVDQSLINGTSVQNP